MDALLRLVLSSITRSLPLIFPRYTIFDSTSSENNSRELLSVQKPIYNLLFASLPERSTVSFCGLEMPAAIMPKSTSVPCNLPFSYAEIVTFFQAVHAAVVLVLNRVAKYSCPNIHCMKLLCASCMWINIPSVSGDGYPSPVESTEI